MMALIATFALAAAPAHWEAGEQAFREGESRTGDASREAFARAAAAFAEVARESPEHVEAYVNLGTAHFRAGDLPRALAALHAGLAVDPVDRRLHERLAAARRDVAIPEQSRLTPARDSRLSLSTFAYFDWIAAAGLLVAAIFLPVGLRSGNRAGAAIGAVGVVLCLVGLGFIFVRQRAIEDRIEFPTLVVRDGTPLRLGNAEAFPTLVDLPRGYEVTRLGIRGDWLHVRCPGGQVGWIPAASLAVP